MTQPGQKHALLVGIDQYVAMKDLDGCANDIDLMRGILIDRFGFPKENIRVLLDEEATEPAIVAAWEELIEKTGEGDIVVTHYAGHGSQLPDLEDDQPDGFDETIVTHESHHRDKEEDEKDEKKKYRNTDITNDQINDWLVGLSQKKPGNITVIFDCCHSGTMTRDASGGKARMARGDRRTASVMGREPFERKYAKVSTGGQEFGASRWLPLSDEYVLIAGCRDEELSYEKAVKHGEKRRAHGSLTYHLCEELKKATSGSTYRDVFEPTRAAVTAHDGRQHPQIEGAQDKAVFGVETITPMRYIEVAKRDGEVVELDGGTIHGMTVGSKWAVYPPGTKSTDGGEKVGVVEITSVNPATGLARVVEGTEDESTPIVQGGRAVLEEYSYGDLVLTYRVIVDPGLAETASKHVAGLMKALAEEGLVREVEGDEPADARIYLIDERSEVDPEKDPAPQLGGLAEPTWAVITADGELMMPPKKLDGWKWTDEKEKKGSIASNLRILAGLRHAMALDNPDSDNPLRGKVKLHLWRKDASDAWAKAHPEAGGQFVFKSAYRDAEGKVRDKEHIGFSVELDADYPDALYLNLIALDPAGIINVIYPPVEAHEKLEPGREFKTRQDTRPGEKPMFFGLPENYPFYRDPLASGPIEGPQTFKLFVSTVPLNLRFIEQTESVRGGVRSEVADSNLQILFEGALGSRAGFEDEDEGATLAADKQGWTTVTRTVTLRRAADTDTTELKRDGGEVSIGEVVIEAPNIVGTAKVEQRESGSRSASPESHDSEFMRALWASGLTRRASIRIDGTSSAGDTERSADGPAPATVRVPDPGPEMGQAVLTTDDSGLLRWHFETPEKATRGASERGPRTYELDDLDLGAEEAPEASRGGIAGILIKKAVEVVVFPLLDPIGTRVGSGFASVFEKKRRPYRVRRFRPDDYGTLEASEVDETAWKELAAGPSLLMLHGPFKRTHGAFGSMPEDYVKELYQKYDGRVFAFDHFTMSHDPAENVKELLSRVPDGTKLNDVDVIGHSRGGLVGRVLAEQQGDSPKLGIRRVVFVGSPNAGTALASGDHVSDFINHYTNLFGMLSKVIGVVDQAGIVDGIESVLTAVKQLAVGAFKGLDGIQCMGPDSPFIKGLNEGSVPGDRYFALASNFDPERAGTARLLMGKLAGRVFGGSDNDLVVPSRSVIDRRTRTEKPPGGTERRKQNGESAWIGAQLVFESGASDEAIAHDSYFANQAGRQKIIEWLSA